MTTGIVKDRIFLEHKAGAFHPESPARLEAIYGMIEADPAFRSFPLIPPRPASEAEVRFIHTPEYFELVRNTAGKERFALDPDTSTSARSYEVALLAAGSLLKAAEFIIEGRVQNAFAFVRPPGHHAEAGRAMGFCLFNNAAIAAECLVRRFGLTRILIVDWDLHHGNGTQRSFYGRKDVLYFSTHQFPYYPGTGWWNETGAGQAEGYTFNVPLTPGKTDADYLFIFRNILSPIAVKFRPEFIIVSTGFDIGLGDPLGGMLVTAGGFGALAAELMGLAESYGRGRILFALEGGYDLGALREGCREVLSQMAGLKPRPAVEPAVSDGVKNELAPAFGLLKKYW